MEIDINALTKTCFDRLNLNIKGNETNREMKIKLGRVQTFVALVTNVSIVSGLDMCLVKDIPEMLKTIADGIELMVNEVDPNAKNN